MIVTLILLGGCFGIICAGLRCVESGNGQMSMGEWKYKHNNKVPLNHYDEWYRYL